MDATQQSDAAAKPSAPINPSAAAAAAELGAYFRVMRLGDNDPSAREQPPRVPVPATRAEVLMQQLQAAKQQDFPYPLSYGAGESSTPAGYVPPYGSLSTGVGFYASHFGAYNPRLNDGAPAASTSTPQDHDAGHSDPTTALPRPSESHSSSAPSSSASPYPYRQLIPSAPPLGAASFPWADGIATTSSLNPYASAFQSTLSANAVGMDYPSWIPTPARCNPTLEQVRSRLLRRPMELDLLMVPQTAAHVARLLEEGDDKVRRSVLARVRGDVRAVAARIEGQSVLLALVRACAGLPDELKDIVHAVYKGNGFPMGVAKHNHGLATLLKELVRNLVPYPQMLVQFMCWLLRERLMEQYHGAELLQYCFTTMSYEGSKIIIQFATVIVNELLFSSFGSRCLAECLAHARDSELRALEHIILSRTIEIAMGQYSNYFMQRAIELGSEHLQAAIAERVAADVASLSLDRFGSYVVEACFLLARTPAPLQLLLAAFQGLHDDALAELVRGNYSNYVVSKLLDAARQHFPQHAKALARRIEKLPAAVQREMHARRVMMVVNKLTHKNLCSQPTLYY